MKTNMNYGAFNALLGRARQLRSKQTYAEILLWSRLRNRQLGVHFRRQHPMSNFVVDFYCHSHLLVIELDGSVHLDKMVKQEDETKEASLLSLGLTVLRYTNQRVIRHLDDVVDEIRQWLISNNHQRTDKGPL